jgi:cysteine desulfurase/selenocysteine lyase
VTDPAPTARPRLGDRSLFPTLAPFAYLNHASVSPPSLAVWRGVETLLRDQSAEGALAVGKTVAMRSRLRERIARLLGVRGEDVALTSGATGGLQMIALSLPWRRRERVLLFHGEFPANVTPWQRAAELFDLEAVLLPLAPFERSAEEGLAALEEELRRGARLAAVSAVQFRSGLAMPLGAMADLCHRQGAELCVDAIQALGAVPLDAAAAGIDYLASGGHKWLMGVEGAGFVYVRPDRVAALRTPLAGWLSHEDAVSFLTEGPGRLRYDRPIRRDVRMFEGGSSSALSQAALEAALGVVLELGVAAIHAHVNRYLDALEPALLDRGFLSLRAPEPERRSGILSAVPPRGRDPRALRDGLARRGVVVALPDGLVRFSPHWPNDAGRELGGVIAAIDAALGGA